MKLIDKILIKEIKPHILGLLFIFLLILLGVGFETIAPLPFKILIDNVLGNETIEPGTYLTKITEIFGSKESLGFFVILIYFIASMSGSITEYFTGITTKKLNKAVINDFSRKAFDNLEELSIGYYKKQEIGDIIYRLSYDVTALGDILELGLIPLITNVFHFLFTIVIMFIISVKLALIGLAIVPVLAVALLIFNKRIGRAEKRSETTNSTLFSFIQEALSQLKIIQAFNQEKKESQSFREKEGFSLLDELNVQGFAFVLNLIIGVVIAVGYSMIIVYGIRSVYAGEITTGLLIVFIFYLDNLTNPLLSLMTAASSLKEDYIKVSRMGQFFDSKSHIHDRGMLANIENYSISFENVSIYGEGRTPILRNATFRIPEAKTTVIVGVSGSGKTTIISAILRFVEPTKGKIILGSHDIRDYSVRALREQIAYVPQEIVLFNDTVKNNIAFGSPAASDDQIKAAARLAVSDGFINRLPGKYNFYVGEEGVNLSGGQKQRLMLARAFAKSQANILIFDEPLSALDVKTRALLMDNFYSFAKGKTTIIVTNILEIVNRADNIILVNQGEIMHAGTAKALRTKTDLSSLILHST